MRYLLFPLKNFLRRKFAKYQSILYKRNRINSIEGKKKVAVCYLGINSVENHTNFSQQSDLVELLEKMGFGVDLWHCDDFVVLNHRYDIVLGFGESWRRLVDINKNAVHILYATESPAFVYRGKEFLSLNRIGAEKKFYSARIRSGRYYVESDFWRAKSVMQMGAYNCEILRVSGIGGAVYELSTYGLRSDLSRKKNNRAGGFLWFGSSGVYAKGLDLLVSIFRENKEFQLYVAGCPENELKELGLLPSNVIFLGTIEVGSEGFFELVEKCDYCVMPTVGEGISTAVVTCMYFGLVPIVTKEANVEAEGCFYIKSNKSDILKAIKSASEISDEMYYSRSECVRISALNRYSKNSFSASLSDALVNMI